MHILIYYTVYILIYYAVYILIYGAYVNILFGAYINPLVTDPLYLVCMAKISVLKKKGSSKKFPISLAPMSR